MKRSLILMAIVLSIAVFITGVLTDLRFSDELHHFLFAKEWYNLGYRPIYIQSVNNLQEIGYGYVRQYGEVPLWHFGLLSLWKLQGLVSKNVAQFYQVLFYFFLILCSYLLAKELYGENIGWHSAMVIATTPLIVAFSTLLYQEVPVAGLTTLCLLLIIKRKIVWAAVAMGLAFLTKRNAYFLFPAFLLIILIMRNISPRLSIRIKKAFLFILIVLVIIIPDFIFRYKNLGWLFFQGDQGRVLDVAAETAKAPVVAILSYFNSSVEKLPRAKEESPRAEGESPRAEGESPQAEKRFIQYVPGAVYRPISIPQYLGISLLFLLVLFSLNVNKIFSSQDFILIIPIFIYLILFLAIFREWAAARFLAPVVPLLAILSSKVFVLLKNKKLKYFIFGLCVVQFLSVLIFVYMQRRLTVSEKGAFDYIKKKSSIEARILTPEELCFFYYTHLPSIWITAFDFVDKADSRNFFWDDDELKKKAILEKYKISHIFVQKRRIYDDSSVRHFGGWPISFVERLPSMPFLENIFENKDVSIWKVRL